MNADGSDANNRGNIPPDHVWMGVERSWADVATAGFRLIGVEDVPHFKLMCSPPVLEAVLRELGAAALAHARFDT